MEDQLSSVFPPLFGPADTAVIGVYLRIRLAETGKVFILEQNLGSLVHWGHVGYIPQQPRPAMQERIFLKMRMIFVGTLDSVEPGAGFREYRTEPFCSNVMR